MPLSRQEGRQSKTEDIVVLRFAVAYVPVLDVHVTLHAAK